MKKFIAYYRVSTQRQGQSGLGLEAQQAAVNIFVSGKGEIINQYTEIESGKKNNRQQLLLAIDEAKAAGATLIIAKLDRLSRDVAFIFRLRDSGVDFQCCDIPDMNTLSVGLFAVIAQHERELISSRTKAALAAKKARGERLGNPTNFTDAGRAAGRAQNTLNAANDTNNQQAFNIIQLLHQQKHTTRYIADYLNKLNYKTRRGCCFTSMSVHRLLPA